MAYYEKAVCIDDTKSIVLHYIKGSFAYDLISLLPFLAEANDYSFHISFKFWNLLVFMKLKSIKRIYTDIHDMVLTNKFLLSTFKLFKLFFWVVFVAHCFGLLWLG